MIENTITDLDVYNIIHKEILSDYIYELKGLLHNCESRYEELIRSPIHDRKNISLKINVFNEMIELIHQLAKAEKILHSSKPNNEIPLANGQLGKFGDIK